MILYKHYTVGKWILLSCGVIYVYCIFCLTKKMESKLYKNIDVTAFIQNIESMKAYNRHSHLDQLLVLVDNDTNKPNFYHSRKDINHNASMLNYYDSNTQGWYCLHHFYFFIFFNDIQMFIYFLIDVL